MTFATYTLSKNGQAIKSDTGSISGEWWLPGAVSGLGVSYETMATVLSEDQAEAQGVFDTWLPLESDVSWTAIADGEQGNAVIQVTIRESISRIELGTAEIQLGNSTALIGDFYWSMDIPQSYFYKMAPTNSYHQLQSALSLPVGSTVEFDTFPQTSFLSGKPLVYSSVSAPNSFYLRAGTETNNLQFLNCTVEVDGESVTDNENVLIGGAKQHIKATITAATDLQWLGWNGSTGMGINIGVGNLVVNDTVDTYSWPLNNRVSSTQPEENFGTNPSIIQNYNALWWNDTAFERNKGAGGIMPLSVSQAFTGNTVLAQQTSLRDDGAGTCILYNGGDYQIAEKNIPMASGFTLEGLVRINSFQSSGGSTAGNFLQQNWNNAFENLWVLRFDNFDGSGLVRPCFSLINRNTSYSTLSNYGNVAAEVRGTESVVIGQVYHMLATIRPSDDTIEFWLNGVSLGTDTIPVGWYDIGGDPGQDVLTGARSTRINFGPGFLSGAWRGSSCLIQDVRIHLLEADQAFASAQYNGNLPASS